MEAICTWLQIMILKYELHKDIVPCPIIVFTMVVLIIYKQVASVMDCPRRHCHRHFITLHIASETI